MDPASGHNSCLAITTAAVQFTFFLAHTVFLADQTHVEDLWDSLSHEKGMHWNTYVCKNRSVVQDLKDKDGQSMSQSAKPKPGRVHQIKQRQTTLFWQVFGLDALGSVSLSTLATTTLRASCVLPTHFVFKHFLVLSAHPPWKGSLQNGYFTVSIPLISR